MVGGGGPNRTEDGYYVTQGEIELEWVKHYGESCPYADPLPLVSQMQRKDLARRRREEKAAHLYVLEGPSAERQESSLPQATRTAPAACRQPPQTQLLQIADTQAQRARSARRPRAVGRTRKKKAISRIDRDVRASREAEALVLRRLQEAITYAERVLPKLYGRTAANQADSAEQPALPAHAQVHGTLIPGGAQRASGKDNAAHTERPATVKTAPAPTPAKAETAARVGRAGRLAMPSPKKVMVPERKVEPEKRTTHKHARKRVVEKMETERVQTKQQAGSHSRERVHVSEQQTDRAPPASLAPRDDAPGGQALTHDAQPSAIDPRAAQPAGRQETEPVAHPAEQLPPAGEARRVENQAFGAEQERGGYEAESFEEEIMPSAVIAASHAHDLSTDAPLAASSHGDKPLQVHAEVPSQPVVMHAEVPTNVSQAATTAAPTNRAGHSAWNEEEGEYAAEFEEEKEETPRTATVTERASPPAPPASLTTAEREAANEQVDASEVLPAQNSQAVPSKEGMGDNRKESESEPLSMATAVEGRGAVVEAEDVMSTRSLAASEVETTVLSPAHVERESVREGSQNVIIARRLSTDGYESEYFDEESWKAEGGGAAGSGSRESNGSLAEEREQDGSIHAQPVRAIAVSDTASRAIELEQPAVIQPEQQPPTEAEASGRAPLHEHVPASDRSITASSSPSQGVDGLVHADSAALYSPTHEPQTDSGARSNPSTSLGETASVLSRTPSTPADHREAHLLGVDPHSRSEDDNQSQVEVEAPRSSQPAHVPRSSVVEGQAEAMVPSTEGQPADFAISSGIAPTDDTRAGGDSAAKVAALGRREEVDAKQDAPLRPPSDLLKAIREKPALQPVPAKVDAAQAENEAMEKEQRLQDELKRSTEALMKLQTFLQDQALLVPFEALTVDEEESRLLGRGRKARVYTADLSLNGITQVVAVKEFEYDRERHFQPPTAVVESCARELEMLHKLHHPAILTLLGAQISPSGGLRVVTELIQRSLHDLIRDTASWSRVDSLAKFKVLQDVLSGLSAMHELRMVHRDIKSHNILVGQDPSRHYLSAKIADLGAARMLDDDESVERDECGTSGWTAPEVLRCDAYDAKADVFSFGVVMWEVLCGCSSNPLSSLSVERLCDELMRVGSRDSREQIPEDTPPAARALLHDCLRVDPGLRPTSSEAFRRLDDIINGLVSTTARAPPEPAAAAEEEGLRAHQDAHAVQSEKQQLEVMVSAAGEQEGKQEEGAEEQDYDDFEPDDEETREDAPVVAVPATTYHPLATPARKDEATGDLAQPTAVSAHTAEAPLMPVVHASAEAPYVGVDRGEALRDEQEDEYSHDEYDESEDHVKSAQPVSGHGGSVQSAEGDSAYADDDFEE